jgi:hypothetical protein
MSDLPDRTPQRPDEDEPHGLPAEPSATGYPTSAPGAEEPTQVHSTTGTERQDSSITAFTPAPERDAAPEAPAAATAAAPRKVSVRNRGRMRRRLRYLRRVRELGYRDLGGLVFELRRAGVDNEVLVGAKVDALYSIDQELHVLEHGLRDFLSVEELHEPGVSVCLRCGALHGSDANFCPQCGTRVDVAGTGRAGAEPATVVGAPAAGTTGSYPGAGSTTGVGREPR